MKIYGHLSKVETDARERAKIAREAIGNNKFRNGGWDDEKWNNYHLCRALEAEAVAHYCFIRMMQIDPD